MDPPPEGKTQVDHIDHNRLNNSPENLRWVSVDENQQNRTNQAEAGLYITSMRLGNYEYWRVSILKYGIQKNFRKDKYDLDHVTAYRDLKMTELGLA